MNKRKEAQPNSELGDSVRSAGKSEILSKGVTTNWNYRLYQITEFVRDTKPSNHINNLPGRQNEASLKETELAMKEIETLLKGFQLY